MNTKNPAPGSNPTTGSRVGLGKSRGAVGVSGRVGTLFAALPVARQTLAALVAALVVMSAAAPVEGHALWVSPAPRDQQDGYKDPPRAPPGTGAPCGIGRAAGQPVAPAMLPGQPLTVSWRETVDHPGCFVVDFAEANDTAFTILGVKSHANPPQPNTPRDWSLQITLPNISCAACTLRLRQLMLAADLPDAQCPPSTIPAGATYYSCANVQLGTGAASDASAIDAPFAIDATRGPDAGSPATGNTPNGCSCTTANDRTKLPTSSLLVLAALALAARRRRT